LMQKSDATIATVRATLNTFFIFLHPFRKIFCVSLKMSILFAPLFRAGMSIFGQTKK